MTNWHLLSNDERLRTFLVGADVCLSLAAISTYKYQMMFTMLDASRLEKQHQNITARPGAEIRTPLGFLVLESENSNKSTPRGHSRHPNLLSSNSC